MSCPAMYNATSQFWPHFVAVGEAHSCNTVCRVGSHIDVSVYISPLKCSNDEKELSFNFLKSVL